MRYEVIESETPEGLQTAVNAKARQGYEPQGGMVTTLDGYAQAVVHRFRSPLPAVEPS